MLICRYDNERVQDLCRLTKRALQISGGCYFIRVCFGDYNRCIISKQPPDFRKCMTLRQDRNEMKWYGLYATFVHIQAKLGQENILRMVRWVICHFPLDTWFEIQTLEVWGRARYLSVTEAPHNTSFTSGWGRNVFVSFKPPRPGNEPRTLAWEAAVLITTLGPPPISTNIEHLHKNISIWFASSQRPNKHRTLILHCVNVGPASATLDQL